MGRRGRECGRKQLVSMEVQKFTQPAPALSSTLQSSAVTIMCMEISPSNKPRALF